MNRNGKLFCSFSPAVSPSAVKSMRETIQARWASCERSQPTVSLFAEPDIKPILANRCDKYLYIKEDTIMGTIDEQQKPSDDDDIETLKSIIRKSLEEIANDIGVAMRDAHLNFPVGLTTPSSGSSIVTMVTPVDPSDDDWSHATSIIRGIVAKKLGGIRLCSHSLPCAMVNATTGGAEITANTLDFDTHL
jgi:hypothetical protein